MQFMVLPLYRLLTRAAPLVLGRMLRKRAARGKEIAERLGERRGIEATPRPTGRLIWLHAASVGETVSILPVIAALIARDAGVSVLVTTGTRTSAELLEGRLAAFAGRVRHRFVPLDVPAWVARFLDHWRPDVAGFVDSEIWPNLVLGCRSRGIPLMLVNARLSEVSYLRWRQLPKVAARLFGAFAAVQPQTEAIAERLRRLGAVGLMEPGNLKLAAPALVADPAEVARLEAVLATRPVWLAASTHPGEEALILAVHAGLAAIHAGVVTIIVPRHPHRGAEVAALVSGAVTRRALGQAPPAGGGVWVADTVGELGLLYRCARIVFVGKSLAVGGGQNPLEPARLGCAVAMGPMVANFAEIAADLAEAGALQMVADAVALERWVDALLRDPARRAAIGAAGVAASRRAEGLPALVAGRLLALMGPVA